jgi:hypothetical protein
MSGEVIFRAFRHEHNELEVARQEYDAAREHFREMRDRAGCLSSEGQDRLTDARERRDVARGRYLALLAR